MPKLIPKSKLRLSQLNKTPVTDYLQAKEVRENRLWRCENGVLKTLLNFQWITAEEFDKRFPLPVTINFYGDKGNPDKRNLFLLD